MLSPVVDSRCRGACDAVTNLIIARHMQPLEHLHKFISIISLRDIQETQEAVRAQESIQRKIAIMIIP